MKKKLGKEKVDYNIIWQNIRLTMTKTKKKSGLYSKYAINKKVPLVSKEFAFIFKYGVTGIADVFL